MICPRCNGQGFSVIAKWKCPVCGGSGYVEMTNEEYLRSLNTEQLAEYFASTFDLCGAGCHHCFLAKECLTKAKNGNPLTQEQMIVEWLKQPHRDTK